MTKEELVTYIEEHPDQKHMYETMSGAVHDMAAISASNINNEGAEAQVEYLLDNDYSIEELYASLEHGAEV